MIELLNVELLFSTLRLALPMAFAVLGGVLAERSGIAQIGLEGMMLTGAVTAASVAALSQSGGAGLGVAILSGVLLALAGGFFMIRWGADQIIVGTAVNLFAMGFAPFLTEALFDSTGNTPSLPQDVRLSWEVFPIFILCAVSVIYIFHRTQAGLWIKFAGENPEVLRAAGLSTHRVRWFCVAAAGALAALGGGTLSVASASGYSPMMTAGRGFMALAAVIFGAWRPGPALLACLFFSFADAVQIRLQGVSSVPVQFIQILPYAVTIIALAGFYRRGRAPASLGKAHP